MGALPRRDFLKLMGASLALAGLSGCAFQPNEKIVPYVNQPESYIPGIASYYATAMPFAGYALGLLARSTSGRPVKVEGNPDHPTSGGAARIDPATGKPSGKKRGATDVWAQASLLSMYDPERSQTIRKSGATSNWDTFAGEITAQIQRSRRESQGADFALITETITSPTQLSLIQDIQDLMPEMRWISYEPVNRDNVTAGTRLAFGRNLHPVYHFDRADVIVSLDCDFLLEEPGRVAHAREFIEGRARDRQNRAHLDEPLVLHRVHFDYHRLGGGSSFPGQSRASRWHRARSGASGRRARRRGRAAGDRRTEQVGSGNRQRYEGEQRQSHRRGGCASAASGSRFGDGDDAAVGPAFICASSIWQPSDSIESANHHLPCADRRRAGSAWRGFASGCRRDERGKIKTALIIGSNPAYSAPRDLGFAAAMKKVGFTAHVGMFDDETGQLCTWHVPESHYLEQWSDVRAIDGTVSIVQPIIMPLYETCHSPLEVLAAMAGNVNSSGYDVVRGYWARTKGLVNDGTLAAASDQGELAKGSTLTQLGAQRLHQSAGQQRHRARPEQRADGGRDGRGGG